jgi:hypothetical protein
MENQFLAIGWLCFWFGLCVFLILICSSKEQKYFSILPSKELSWAFAAAVIVFSLFQPFVVFPNLLSGTSEAFSHVANLALAVIGLVITTSTGIAVATSWKALEDAKSADRHATKALGEFVELKSELDRQILSHSAYLEALSVQSKYNDDKDSLEYRIATGYCDALLSPDESSRRETLAAINSVSEYAKTAGRILQFSVQRNNIREYFISITKDPNESLAMKSMFGKLTGELKS